MKNNLLILVVLLAIAACSKKGKKITVKNNLDFDRIETITIPYVQFDSLLKTDPSGGIEIIDNDTDSVLTSQRIDLNGDGVMDELIFQAAVKANHEKKFRIVLSKVETAKKLPEERTYSRFVPERIDDYAWENNLVAFRTYGPEAQRLVDEKQKGGTLSSGMDCWLKRVNYPVIDKWYKKYVDGGTYHKDDGEGYDPYHVGDSRGCGGIGILKNDSLYVSKNFTGYKIIANGPLRTIFELTYAPWQVDDATIGEKKVISIDLGSQMSRFEVLLNTSDTLPGFTIGITLHNKKGKVLADSAKGWFRYWEPIDDSEIGTGVVCDPSTIQSYRDYRTNKKDLSHIYVTRKPASAYVYYAGFAWTKAGVITKTQDWDNYLDKFAQRLASPVEVVFEK